MPEPQAGQGRSLEEASWSASPRDPREAERRGSDDALQDQLELSRPEKKIASVFGHSLRS